MKVVSYWPITLKYWNPVHMCQTAFVQTRVRGKFFSAYILCHNGVWGNGSMVVHTLNVSISRCEFELSVSQCGHLMPKKCVSGKLGGLKIHSGHSGEKKSLSCCQEWHPAIWLVATTVMVKWTGCKAEYPSLSIVECEANCSPPLNAEVGSVLEVSYFCCNW